MIKFICVFFVVAGIGCAGTGSFQHSSTPAILSSSEQNMLDVSFDVCHTVNVKKARSQASNVMNGITYACFN